MPTLNQSFKDYIKDKPDYQYALGNDSFINTTNLKENKTYLFLIQGRTTYNFDTTRDDISATVILGRLGDLGKDLQEKYEQNLEHLENEARKLRQYFSHCRHHRLDSFYWELDPNKYAENLDTIRITATFYAYNINNA